MDLVTKFHAKETRFSEVLKEEPKVIMVYVKLTANQPSVMDHEGSKEKKAPKASKAQFMRAPAPVAKIDNTIPKPSNCNTGRFGFINIPTITKRFQRTINVIP